MASHCLPATLPPSAPLSRDLELLYDFLLHQKATTPADASGAELLELSDKALDAKVRELENWNFRLNLDEAKEISESVAKGILSAAPPPPSPSSSSSSFPSTAR